MKIVWSDIAEANLDNIYDYIARDVPYYAEQFTDKLIDAVGALGSVQCRLKYVMLHVRVAVSR